MNGRHRQWVSRLAVLACGMIAVIAGGQERSPIVLQHANSLSAVEENGVRRQELNGNVRITKDSLDVTCQNAVYYPDSGVVVFRTDVEFRDPHRTLFADEVIYNEFTEQLQASGRVRVYQQDTLSAMCRSARYFERLKQGYLYDDVRIREEKRRMLLTGQRGYLNHDRQYGWVTGHPVLTERDSLLKLVTEVRGDTVKYFGEDKRVQVTGHVEIDRDSLVATGTDLDYFTQGRMAILLGTPRALRGTDDIAGDTMKLYFEKERLSKVEVIGHAVVTSPADSGFVEPRHRMDGKRMTLWVDNGVVTSALVEGTATATYYVRDKGEKRGLNVTSGDSLRVIFEDRKISRIRVLGGTEGTYTPEKLVPKPSS